MKRLSLSVLISIICILSTIVFTDYDIDMVKGDDPPLDTPAYHYEHFIPPENSFGMGETTFKTPIWSYWKAWLIDNFYWNLKGSPSGDVWYNDTIGLMEIGIDWDEINNTAKVTLVLNTTNAPQALYYRFELGCNASLKSYINKSSNYEYTLTLPANLTEDYNLTFNFSDIKPLVTSGKVTVRYGVKNIDGNDYFGFRVQTVNKIDVGKVFVVDPTFGYTGTNTQESIYSDFDNTARLYGTFSAPSSSGTVDNITVDFQSTDQAVDVQCGIIEYVDYSSSYGGTVLAKTEERSISGSGNEVFIFNVSNQILVTASTNYYVCVWGSGLPGNYDAIIEGYYIPDNATITKKSSSDSYLVIDSPLTGDSAKNNVISAYCSYTETPTNTAPTQSAQKIWNDTTNVEKSLNATNVDLQPTCFNVTINDADGDKMNITIMENSSGWKTVNQTTGSGLSNGTTSYTNTSWVDSHSTKYWISFNVTDGTDWCNETYNFTTTNPPTVTTFNVDQDDGGSNLWDLDNNDIQIDYDLDDADGGALTAYITYKFSSSPTDPSSSNYDAQITGITSPWSANDVDLNWRNDGHSDNHAVNSDAAWVDTTNDVYIKIIAYDGTSYSSANEDTTDRPVGIDGTNPTGTIDTYDDTENPTSIEGDTADVTSGVASNDIQIYDNDDSDYWTGSAWGGQTWLDCSGTTSWSYDSSGVPWDSAHNITITLRAYDNAGNVDSNVDTEYFTTNAHPTVTNPVPANDSSGQSLTPTLSVDVGDLDLMGDDHTNWHEYGMNSTRQGHQPVCDFAPIENTSLWSSSYDGGADNFAGPIVHDGLVYINGKGANDNLFCFYLNNGTEKWNTSTGDCDDTSTYYDGYVYVQTGEGDAQLTLFKIDAITGVEDWHFNLPYDHGNNYSGSPAIGPTENMVYVVGAKVVYGVNITTGAMEWHFNETDEGDSVSSPTYHDGEVIVPFTQDTVIYNATTGAVAHDSVGLSWDSSPTIAENMAGSHDMMYIGQYQSSIAMRCNNATTGAYRWAWEPNGSSSLKFVFSTPAFHDNKLFFGMRSEVSGGYVCVYCINATYDNTLSDWERQIWNYSVDATGSDEVYSSIAVSNGFVYFGAVTNKVYCLYESNGTEKWTYTLPSNIYSQPAIADGILLIGCDNGLLYAFGDLSQYNKTLQDGNQKINASWHWNDSGNWYNFANDYNLTANQTISHAFPNATSYGTTYYWSVNVTDGTSWTNRTYHFTTTSVFIWIDITNASWDLGNIAMGSSNWTNETGLTFIADMDNCTVNTDLKLQVTNDGADWSAATSGNGPGADTYRLNASIDSWVTEFQIVTASVTTISLDIVAGQNETFDLRFDAPTSTSVSTQQSITVTATLVEH